MAPGFSTMGSSSLYQSVTKIRDDILSMKCRAGNLCRLKDINFTEIYACILMLTLKLPPMRTVAYA